MRSLWSVYTRPLVALTFVTVTLPVPRGLSTGPVPAGTYVGLVVRTTLSSWNPSSRIHTLMVWRPVEVTSIVATGPSMVAFVQFQSWTSPWTRSDVVGATPSMPTLTESSDVVGPELRNQT